MRAFPWMTLYLLFFYAGTILGNKTGYETAITHQAEREVDRFLSALATVESSGNPEAIGDNGAAIGPYQIHKDYWFDAVQADASIGGNYDSCTDPEYAKKIVKAYLGRYAGEALKAGDLTVLASVHHRGPSGVANIDFEYWNKIRKAMYEPASR